MPCYGTLLGLSHLGSGLSHLWLDMVPAYRTYKRGCNSRILTGMNQQVNRGFNPWIIDLYWHKYRIICMYNHTQYTIIFMYKSVYIHIYIYTPFTLWYLGSGKRGCIPQISIEQWTEWGGTSHAGWRSCEIPLDGRFSDTTGWFLG